MSSDYNLNEKAGQDYFEFTLDNFKYKMSYPSGDEVLALTEITESTDGWEAKIKKLTKQLETAEDKKPIEAQIKDLTAKAKMAQQSFLDWCMGHIKPEVDSAPNLKEALMAKSIKFLLAFTKMVQTELND